VVVGGYVYRGSAIPELEGYYIFGDYSVDFSPNGTLLWAEAEEDEAEEGGMWSWGELKVAGNTNERVGGYVLAFGEDADGELYVMTSQGSAPTGSTGQVWKLVPATESEAGAETGADEGEETEVPPPASTEDAS
jgi:hypothetical protein